MRKFSTICTGVCYLAFGLPLAVIAQPVTPEPTIEKKPVSPTGSFSSANEKSAFHAREVLLNGLYKDVSIVFWPTGARDSTQIMFAKFAHRNYKTGKGWILSNGSTRTFTPDGHLWTEMRFTKWLTDNPLFIPVSQPDVQLSR